MTKVIASTSSKKNQILQEAKILFYERGYDNTTIEAIASRCGISKSNVAYYFTNKQNLALTVYTNFLKSVKETVTKKYYLKYGNYDLQIGTAVEMRATLHLYKHDNNAFRFFYSVSPLTMYSSRNDTIGFWKMHHRKYRLPINNNIDELGLLASASRGATINLILSYYSKKIHCTFDEFCDYRIEIPFRFMKVDEERIKVIVRESKRIFEELDFKYKPYFVIE